MLEADNFLSFSLSDMLLLLCLLFCRSRSRGLLNKSVGSCGSQVLYKSMLKQAERDIHLKKKEIRKKKKIYLSRTLQYFVFYNSYISAVCGVSY